MFVAVYRTSILGLGADEEGAINHALGTLKLLSDEESMHVCNHLKVRPISEAACDQIIYRKKGSLRIRNGAVEVK